MFLTLWIQRILNAKYVIVRNLKFAFEINEEHIIEQYSKKHREQQVENDEVDNDFPLLLRLFVCCFYFSCFI